MTPSTIRESHGLLHVVERLASDAPGLLAALGNDAPHEIGAVLVLLRALAHGGDLLDHPLNEGLFAVQTADPGRPTALLDPRLRLRVRVDLVQIPHRAL